MKIVVIDGQGGGMGRLLVENFRASAPVSAPDYKIYAIGSNTIATEAMLKAGADFAATGENPLLRNVLDGDCILGPMGIVIAHAILGEITPNMAEAVGACSGKKFLVPMNHCGVVIAGVQPAKLNEYVISAVESAWEYLIEKEK